MCLLSAACCLLLGCTMNSTGTELGSVSEEMQAIDAHPYVSMCAVTRLSCGSICLLRGRMIYMPSGTIDLQPCSTSRPATHLKMCSSRQVCNMSRLTQMLRTSLIIWKCRGCTSHCSRRVCSAIERTLTCGLPCAGGGNNEQCGHHQQWRNELKATSRCSRVTGCGTAAVVVIYVVGNIADYINWP